MKLLRSPHRAVGVLAARLCVACLVAAPLVAQDTTRRAPTPGRVRGRVVADSGGTPVDGAEVRIPALNRSVRTDSLGRYDIPNLASGSVMVQVRAVGFRPESTAVEVRERRIVSLELRLGFDDIVVARPGAAQPLPMVTTKIEQPDAASIASANSMVSKMAEFNSRRQRGVGRFLARADIDKWSTRRTAEMLDALGGLKIENGGLQSWATNGRVPASSCTLCRVTVVDTLDPAVFTSTARQACYMDVYVDGGVAYQLGMEPPEPRYDLNGIAPDAIEAIEVYLGAAQVPAKYGSRLGSGCGVLLIWTRTPPDKKP